VLGGRYSAELGIDVDAREARVERCFVAATLFGARIPAGGRSGRDVIMLGEIARGTSVFGLLTLLREQDVRSRWPGRTACSPTARWTSWPPVT